MAVLAKAKCMKIVGGSGEGFGGQIFFKYTIVACQSKAIMRNSLSEEAEATKSEVLMV